MKTKREHGGTGIRLLLKPPSLGVKDFTHQNTALSNSGNLRKGAIMQSAGNIKTIIIAALMLSSCGREESDVVDKTSRTFSKDVFNLACTYDALEKNFDEATKPYAQEFYNEAENHNVHACYLVKKIELSSDDIDDPNQEGKQIGYCYSIGRIVLSQATWDYLTDTSRRSLMFHELGHCALGLKHAEPGVLNIMRPTLLRDREAEPNWPELLHKLFSKDLSAVGQ